MSTPSTTSGNTESPQLAVAAAAKRRFADFDAIVERHSEDQEGYSARIADEDGVGYQNPDGSDSVAVFYGNSTEVAVRAREENTQWLLERERERQSAGGQKRELTEEERAAQFDTLLRRKYAATLKSIDLWRKNGDGQYHRIELTPEIRQQIFEVHPHFVGDFWLAEVSRRNSFRPGSERADRQGEVARSDGEARVEANVPGPAGDEAQAPAPDGRRTRSRSSKTDRASTAAGT